MRGSDEPVGSGFLPRLIDMPQTRAHAHADKNISQGFLYAHI